MLWSATDWELGQVVRAADDAPSGRPALRAKSEQRLERSHGCLAPVVAENELVEIDLQLMASDAVVRPDEPLLKIPDGAVGEWHHRLGPLAEIPSERLRARNMSIAGLTQPGELLQAVAIDRRARRDVLLDEGQQRRRLKIGDYRQPCTSRPGSALLDGDHHERRFSPLQLTTAAQARLRTSDPRVVDFDLAVQGLARQVDHGPPELVQEQPSRLRRAMVDRKSTRLNSSHEW